MRFDSGRAAWLALAFLLLPLAAHADEALWNLLKAGGHVILIRHATTDPGTGDPPGFRLRDCSTQRNLSEAGRIEARRIGEAFARRSIPVGEVRSSRWCRCLDTARIAFGSGEPWAMLDSLYANPARGPDQTAAVQAFVLDYGRGTNAFLVTHAGNIAALIGATLAPGEMVILKADGNLMRVVGRLKADSG